jgi:NAD(P)-dependent dehydrogenase (short-subunit alcohol dehydrogenase family)
MDVLVTGASTGIGRATALKLAELGHTVFAGARDVATVEDLPVMPLRLDITNPEDIAVAATLDLDALVNNAGIAITGPLEYLPLDEIRRQFEVNAVAQVAVIQACLPALRKSHGRIVNVSSIAGRVALPLFGPYAASKHALEGLSDSLRRELRGAVDVSLVEPGAIATPIWERSIAVADALWEAAPERAHEQYGKLVETMRKTAVKQATDGLPPEAVAQVIATALSASRPRARYLVGREAKIQAAFGRFLPTRAMDGLLKRALRL